MHCELKAKAEKEPIQLVKCFDGVYRTYDGFLRSKWGWKRRVEHYLILAAMLVVIGLILKGVEIIAPKVYQYIANL